MSREWQPGDVAMFPSGRAFVFHRGDDGASAADNLAWMFADGSDMDLRPALFARRLVVIDPEDREQVERLYRLYYGGTPEYQPVPSLLDQLQAALREFANPTPPKPEEPTGLGAVVECLEGRTFVRVDPHDTRFPWVDVKKPNGNAYNWETHGGLDGCTPVRVLSEGVTDV